ncbi:ubiquitin carboxyl-terminal hydrolase 42 [Discoglossus pictus]
MTVVDKVAGSSEPQSCQNQLGNSGGHSSGDMDRKNGSWGVLSLQTDVSNNQVSLEPVPGAAVYSNSSETHVPSKEINPSLAVPGDGIDPPEMILFPSEKLCLKWKKIHKIGAGLQNCGNTCYMNASLQCLTYTAPLANYMLSREHSKACQETGFCMMCILQSHITEVLSNSGGIVRPIAIVKDIQKIAKHFRPGGQEDAHEFLRYAIDALQKCCLKGNNSVNRYTQGTTFIHQVFGGYLRSRVKCLNCKAVSDTYDQYLDITLEIKMAHSVNKALEQFVKPEYLEGDNAYNCSKCKRKVNASKRFTIHRCSNILTLSLKRFANISGGKLTKDVRYPEYLDIRPYTSKPNGEPIMYTLYAVLVHTGYNCHSGHYFSYVRGCNNRWHLMNDTHVAGTEIGTVLNQEAYLLFYIRSENVNGSAEPYSLHTPGPSSPQPSSSQRAGTTKPAFIGPKLPPQIKNTKLQNGSRSPKHSQNNSSVSINIASLKRPSVSNTSLNKPTPKIVFSLSQKMSTNKPTAIPVPSKKQKTIIINKPCAPQGQSLPNVNNARDSSSKPVQPSTTDTPSTTQSTSVVIRELVQHKSSSGPVLNGKPRISSNLLVPYGAESEEESEEELKGSNNESVPGKNINGVLSRNNVGTANYEPVKEIAQNGETSEPSVSFNEGPNVSGVNGHENGKSFKGNESKKFTTTTTTTTNGLSVNAEFAELPLMAEENNSKVTVNNTSEKTFKEKILNVDLERKSEFGNDNQLASELSSELHAKPSSKEEKSNGNEHVHATSEDLKIFNGNSMNFTSTDDENVKPVITCPLVSSNKLPSFAESIGSLNIPVASVSSSNDCLTLNNQQSEMFNGTEKEKSNKSQNQESFGTSHSDVIDTKTGEKDDCDNKICHCDDDNKNVKHKSSNGDHYNREQRSYSKEYRKNDRHRPYYNNGYRHHGSHDANYKDYYRHDYSRQRSKSNERKDDYRSRNYSHKRDRSDSRERYHHSKNRRSENYQKYNTHYNTSHRSRDRSYIERDYYSKSSKEYRREWGSRHALERNGWAHETKYPKSRGSSHPCHSEKNKSDDERHTERKRNRSSSIEESGYDTKRIKGHDDRYKSKHKKSKKKKRSKERRYSPMS